MLKCQFNLTLFSLLVQQCEIQENGKQQCCHKNKKLCFVTGKNTRKVHDNKGIKIQVQNHLEWDQSSMQQQALVTTIFTRRRHNNWKKKRYKAAVTIRVGNRWMHETTSAQGKSKGKVSNWWGWQQPDSQLGGQAPRFFHEFPMHHSIGLLPPCTSPGLCGVKKTNKKKTTNDGGGTISK